MRPWPFTKLQLPAEVYALAKLRVLHIYRTYFPETQGGGQEAIRQLALATRDLGIENTIFTLARNPTPPEVVLPEGRLIRSRAWLEVASCDVGGRDSFLRCREAADQCDIIQIHFPWPFADLMLPFIRRRGQAVVVTYVSDIVRQKGLEHLYAPLRKQLLGHADSIVASSANYASSSDILKQYEDKLDVIPHCLEDAPTSDPELLRHWEARLGNRFLLFVGVLRYYKGLSILLEAARHTKADIVILGEGPEGSKLRRAAQQMGLKNIHFVGALPDADKNALFSLCRAVVLPSHLRSEAFGMTLLEGARASKPLICCEIATGTTAINLHLETGLVVPPSDPASLAQAINRLMADDALSLKLGQGARARWQRYFTPVVVGQAYKNLYEKLIGANVNSAGILTQEARLRA